MYWEPFVTLYVTAPSAVAVILKTAFFFLSLETLYFLTLMSFGWMRMVCFFRSCCGAVGAAWVWPGSTLVTVPGTGVWLGDGVWLGAALGVSRGDGVCFGSLLGVSLGDGVWFGSVLGVSLGAGVGVTDGFGSAGITLLSFTASQFLQWIDSLPSSSVVAGLSIV